MVGRWLDSISFTLAAAIGGIFLAFQALRELSEGQDNAAE